MNHHVVLEKLCACAKKHDTQRIRSFDTKTEAEEYAYEWAESLNTLFCGKHGFDVVAVDENYVISVETGGFVEACEV